MNYFRRKLTCGIFLTSLFLGAGEVAVAAEMDCHQISPVQMDKGGKKYTIDYGWSGTQIGYEGLSDGRKIYTAYYDANRWLTVASLQLDNGTLCKVRLASQFSGWDSHKYPKLFLDSEGVLHVAANMHDSNLVYGHGENPGSINGFMLTGMTGVDENHVTYPRFLRTREGGELFFYRNGSSGNGAWYINKLEHGKWSKLIDKPIYTDRWEGSPVSAYPSSPLLDRAGYYHIAIVWRRNSDVSSNFALSYVKTANFTDYFSIDGVKLKLPVSPEKSALIIEPGPMKGLVNNAQVAVDGSGNPVVFYTKYDSNGMNGAFAADFRNGKWVERLIDSSTSRVAIQGGGSIKMPVSFGGDLDAVPGETAVSVSVKLAGKPTTKYVVGTENLTVDRAPEVNSKKAAAITLSIPGGMERAVVTSGPVNYEEGFKVKRVGSIVYYAQLPNGDRPHNCTSSFPKACQPIASPIEIVLDK